MSTHERGVRLCFHLTFKISNQKLIAIRFFDSYVYLMFISSSQLDAFFAVAQALHFSKAAEKLHITQSALSQRILALEKELGLTLFIRERSGVQLTEGAYRLLQYCQSRNALEEELLSEFETSAGSSFAGTIRLAGFSSVTRSVILPSLAVFMRENPRLRLEILTRETSELPGLLRRGEVDYIIVDQDLKRDGFDGFLLGHEENVLVRSKSFSNNEVFLDHDANDETTKNYLRLSDKDFSKVKRRYLDDVYGLVDGVRLGWGQAVLALHILRDFPDVEIVNPRTVLKTPVYLHFHSQPYFTKLHMAVVSELKKNSTALLKQSRT